MPPVRFFYIISFVLTSLLHSQAEQPSPHVVDIHETAKVPTFIFAHGMWGSKKNAEWYAPNQKSPWYIINGPYISFDFPDVGTHKGAVLRTQVNLGQKEDIKALMRVYDDVLKTFKQNVPNEIVLVGSSRGAITILNTAGTTSLPDLGAIVAEAPADDILHVLDYNLSKYYLNWSFINSLANYLLPYYYKSYDPYGINPLKAINAIPYNIPILLVHSVDDDFVSINSSRAIYYRLVESGHTHVYLVELPHGKHGKYNLGPSADMYQAAVNAFYKKYDIPYNPQLAAEGERYLAAAQPDLPKIKEKLSGVYLHKIENTIDKHDEL